MLNIIIVVLGVLLIVAGVAVFPVRKTGSAALLAIGLAAVIFSQSFTMIETGYTGVKKQFGQISQEVAPTGFNWKTPFIQSIEKVNNKQQDITFEGQIWSETANRTAIYFEDVTVTYLSPWSLLP